MVNINKGTINQIKNIEKKADRILLDADKREESIISGTRSEIPGILKSIKDENELEKTRNIETVKKEVDEKNKNEVEKGLHRVKAEEEKIKDKLEDAATLTLDIFIKKIESI